MANTENDPDQPSRRSFIQSAVTATLALHFPSTFAQQRGTDMTHTILVNAKITTLDPAKPQATAVAIKDGLFEAVGSDQDMMRLRNSETRVIDLKKHTVIPGLNDSHLHVIRGGLH
jgi:imidazolonepropionase-like amidohydrolase